MFVAAGAVIAGAAAVATAPVRAIVGPRYYAPPPAYSGHDALLFCQKIGPSNSAAPRLRRDGFLPDERNVEKIVSHNALV